MTRPIIGRLIIDTMENIPPATLKNKDITFIATDTGEILTCDGTTWSSAGVSLPMGATPTFTSSTAPTDGTSGSYAGVAAHGAPLFDMSQSPPVQYVNTGTQESPTWTQGASGGASYPNVVSNGTGGLIIGGSAQFNADHPDLPAVETGNAGSGFTAQLSNAATGAGVNGITVKQVVLAGAPADGGAVPLYVKRLSPAGYAFAEPLLYVDDQSDSTQPSLQVKKQGTIVFQPPSTLPPLAGALSAVTDPAAKAVLTSIIAALLAYHQATDSTT